MLFALLYLFQSICVVLASEKKGVVHAFRKYQCDDFTLLNRMNWWYNYHNGLNAHYKNDHCLSTIENYRPGFVPMVWGKDSNITIEPGAKYVIGFNEPNHKKQSNLTAGQAANRWPEIEISSKGRPLVSPSAAKCFSECYGNRDEWFDAFFAACSNCRVNFLATHAYWCNATKVMSELRGLYTKYGKKIWLKEFACGDVDDELEMLNFMKDILPQLEAANFIFKYAWFMARIENNDGYVKTAASLLQPDGSSALTPLGIYYNGFEGTEKVDGVWAAWGQWSDCSSTCGTGQMTKTRTCYYPDPNTKDLPCKGISKRTKECSLATCPTTDVNTVGSTATATPWMLWNMTSTAGVSPGSANENYHQTTVDASGSVANVPITTEVTSTPANAINVQTTAKASGPVANVPITTEVTSTPANAINVQTTAKAPGPVANVPVTSDVTSTPANVINVQTTAKASGPVANVPITTEVTSTPANANNVQTTAKASGPVANVPITAEVTSTPDIWSKWLRWSQCSVNCGWGQRWRIRTCLSQECVGSDEEVRSCRGINCKVFVAGKWSDWSPWSSCSVPCGTGTQQRQRRCWFPTNVRNGPPCSGNKSDVRTCVNTNC